ncbi:MAG: lipid II flippase MurJ, partial [Acidobacteriota bacterium]
MSSPERTGGARWVALGIFSSRIFGLVRMVVYSRFLGTGPFADVLHLAMKAPNLLQNLLGEQTLSAAFIPVYSKFLEQGREEEAGRFAGAIFGLMLAAVSLLVVLGMAAAPWLVAVLSPGYLDDAAKVAAGEIDVDRYLLQVRAVRYIFPMAGFMVMAAWAMGVLNSHRRFFLPYMAPAFWNISIVTALVTAVYASGFLTRPEEAGIEDLTGWFFAACTGALIGGILQFAVQLPAVFKTCRSLKIRVSTRVAGVR